jgi:hypothetical protein
MMRRCSECSKRKPLTEYYVGGYNGHSPHRRCKACENRLKRERYAAENETRIETTSVELANRFLLMPRVTC